MIPPLRKQGAWTLLAEPPCLLLNWLAQAGFKTLKPVHRGPPKELAQEGFKTN